MNTQHHPDEPLSPREAEEVLAELSGDGARLAEQAAAPRWYRWAQVLVMCGFVGSLVLEPMPRSLVIFSCALLMNVVGRVYLRRRRVVSSVRSRGMVLHGLLLFAAMLIPIGAGFWIYASDYSNWWGLIPVAVTGCLTVVFDRREEALIQRAITEGSRP